MKLEFYHGMELIELLKEPKEALYQIYRENLRGVYLYGSYAGQQEDLESDVDIAVVLSEMRESNAFSLTF